MIFQSNSEQIFYFILKVLSPWIEIQLISLSSTFTTLSLKKAQKPNLAINISF